MDWHPRSSWNLPPARGGALPEQSLFLRGVIPSHYLSYSLCPLSYFLCPFYYVLCPFYYVLWSLVRCLT